MYKLDLYKKYNIDQDSYYLTDTEYKKGKEIFNEIINTSNLLELEIVSIKEDILIKNEENLKELESNISNFEKIQSIMDKQGTPIVIDDLYGEVGEAGETALMKAIKFGCFYDVLTTVNPDKGIYIKADELLKTNCFEKSALDYIIENGHLDELFDVRLWRGNPDGMRDMWQKVPDCIEKKMVRDFGYRMARVNRENLLNSKKRPKSRLRM